MTSTRRTAYLALLITSLIWGIALPLTKPALSFITPLQYLFFRFLLAGILSLPIFLYYFRKRPRQLSYIARILLIESIQLISLVALYHGLSLTSALEASLIGSTTPLFVVLGGIWWLKERETRREWRGLSLAVLGSLLLVLEPLWSGEVHGAGNLSGNLYILLYCLLYTFYALVAKRYYKRRPPLSFGALIYLLGALIYGLILVWQGSLPPLSLLTSSPVVTSAVLYMAIPGGMLCFALYLFAQSKIEVSEATLFTYLNGVFAIPASFLLLGEIPSLTAVLAILTITYGVYYGQTARPRSPLSS